MYEDLIKRLRTHNGWALNKTLDEAADAIKELQDRIAASEATIKRQSDIIQAKDRDLQREIDAKPQWISVTETLPKKEKKMYWVCTNTGNQCECRWTNNRFGIGESDEWGWCIFDIPQYQNVVAWMPLPDPYKPKEET